MDKNVVKIIILFIFAFGAISLMLTQVITMERYLLNIAFLLIVALIIVFYFKKEISDVIEKTKKQDLILIMISLIIHAVTSYFILRFLNQPTWPFSNHGASFLLMNNFYIWTKPFDILVQQLLIIVLVKKLSEQRMNLKQITLIFILGFGAIHIFQIFKTDIIIGLAFTAGALLSSVLYPYMILKVKNGYIYNYMIHLAIYNIAAILTWTLY